MARLAQEPIRLAYRAFDLMEAGPQRIAQMLAELVELFKTEALHRLPVKSWDVRHAREAWPAWGSRRSAWATT